MSARSRYAPRLPSSQMDDIPTGKRSYLTGHVHEQSTILTDVHSPALDDLLLTQDHPYLLAHGTADLAIVLHQRQPILLSLKTPHSLAKTNQDGRHHLLPGHLDSGHRQRDSPRELHSVARLRDVDTDPDDAHQTGTGTSTGRLCHLHEDSTHLPVPDQDVVGPLQTRVSTEIPQALDNRHTRSDRQQLPVNPSQRDSHRHRDCRA